MEAKKKSKAWKAAQRPHLAPKSVHANVSVKPITKLNSEIKTVSMKPPLPIENEPLKRPHDDVDASSAGKDDQNTKKLKTESSIASQGIIDTSDVSDLPAVIPDSSKALAPAVLGSLSITHEVTNMNIISSSKVQSKVTRILDVLSSFSFASAPKPNIVLLSSKAPSASKMISVVEIAKRELASKGLKWFQYNRLEQIMEEKKPQIITMILGRAVEAAADEDVDMDTEDGTSFETLKTPLERAIEGRPKVRAIPIMTIYLSRVSIETLKSAYGEQTNATLARK